MTVKFPRPKADPKPKLIMHTYDIEGVGEINVIFTSSDNGASMASMSEADFKKVFFHDQV